MRKTILLIFICCQACLLAAQKNAPKWMDKQRKAVVTVTTFNRDNKQIASGNAVFVTETGEAISGYSLFKDAARAVVKDADGKEMPVVRILGADELYDVIKFKVNVPKKVAFLPLAAEPVANGTTAYLMPYSQGKLTTFGQGTVAEVSKLKDPYSYYKIAMPLEPGQANAPLLTDVGELFGLAQEDASGKNADSYAVSAGYANSLSIAPADAFNPIYNSIGIRKAWPAEPGQAQVALYLFGNVQDAQSYLETLNDFIATFPQSPDGYLSRAGHYAYHRAELASSPEEQRHLLDKALEDMENAARFTEKKSDNLYERAKLIYNISVADSSLKGDAVWNADVALETLQKAIEENDQPLYHQLRGDIRFNKGAYEEAYDDYMVVNHSDMALPSSWYMAAKAKQNLPGVNFGELIALLDSAVTACGTPPSQEAATYILERIDLKLKLMNYTEALADYDLYYTVMNGNVNDSFFYYREQAKFRMGDLEGALADIRQALQMNPSDPIYHAEEASVFLRQERYDDALNSIANALKIAPDFASCYRLRGVCLLRQKKADEACEAFHKALELGDPLVERLIKENCK